MSRYIDANKLKKSLSIPCASIIEIGETIIAQIDDQPTADVRENVSGKWVFEDEYVDSDGIRHVFGEPHCSECNYQPYRPEDDRIDECTPYCPNCGAEMGR